MSRLSLGVFSRGRRDMTLSKLSYGSVYTSGSSPQASCYLGNDAKTGTYLAVYGILAYHAANPQLMAAWVINFMDAGTAGNVSMMVPGIGQINGKVTINFRVGPFMGIVNPVIFKADGREWLTLGDIPMFIIPPQYSLVVAAWQQIGSPPTNDPTSCAFLWGVHASPSPPILPAVS